MEPNIISTVCSYIFLEIKPPIKCIDTKDKPGSFLIWNEFKSDMFYLFFSVVVRQVQ